VTSLLGLFALLVVAAGAVTVAASLALQCIGTWSCGWLVSSLWRPLSLWHEREGVGTLLACHDLREYHGVLATDGISLAWLVACCHILHDSQLRYDGAWNEMALLLWLGTTCYHMLHGSQGCHVVLVPRSSDIVSLSEMGKDGTSLCVVTPDPLPCGYLPNKC